MCRLNCVGVEKSEYINVGVKKWLKKTAFKRKKVEAKKGYLTKLCHVNVKIHFHQFGLNSSLEVLLLV